MDNVSWTYRGAPLLPVRDELVESPRLKDVAREDVRADLVPLLHDADADLTTCLRGQLFQSDRCRQAGWTCANDDNVVLDTLPRRHPSVIRRCRAAEEPPALWARSRAAKGGHPCRTGSS